MSGGRWDPRSNTNQSHTGESSLSMNSGNAGIQYKEEDGLFDFGSNDLDEGFEKHDLVDSELFSGSYNQEEYGRYEDPILASFLQYEDASGGNEEGYKRMRLDPSQAQGTAGYLNNGNANWDQGMYNAVQGRATTQGANYAQQIGNSRPQTTKRANYDILSSFFKVYFQPDPKSSIMKDIVYILYWKKIIPVVTRNSQSAAASASNNMNSTTTPLAKNAVYRKMWSVFKDMTSFPEDNKIIKGLRLVTSIDQVPSALDKDVELLRHYLGKNDIFGFTLEELEREVPFDPPQHNALPSTTATSQPSQKAPSDKPPKSDLPFQSSLMMRLERLEQLSAVVNTEITEMKNLIKKEMLYMAEKKRKLQSNSNT
eukprot:TRINITY_DN3345_c0_g2_i2.p2 TRINITY_DN3345_c0_g2~~TRINITY_DN3345_c0_g2_i2.p2  ORF type:complete len:369 (+),score=123.63 TRINITY_DN3345_c0_g2_i2:166-1272(+)